MISLNHILTLGKRGKCKPSRRIRHSKERMIDDTDVGKFPGMNVTFHTNKELRGREIKGDRMFWQERIVEPFALVGSHMSIMQDRIRILDLYLLSKSGPADIRL